MFRPVSIVLLTICLAVPIAVMAVPSGKTLEFKGSPEGTVIFDGELHNKVAGSCNICHNDKNFPKFKKGTVTITMERIYSNELCGICHNGVKAFSAKENCGRCHKKS